MTQHPRLGPPMPFEPNPEQLKHMPNFDKNNIPRYLFRIHTPITAATTTTSYVIAPASKVYVSDAGMDIFKESLQTAGKTLRDHLNGPPATGGSCNLISWTSSLLFALQYGFHRHRDRRYQLELSKIRLFVLDTHDFPKGTFVKDMEIMRGIASALGPEENLHKFLSFRENPRNGGKRYYFGEYLSQGDLALEGRCAEAPIDMPIHAGLFELHPGLGDEDRWYLWAHRVLELREPFLNPSFPQIPPPTDRRLVRKAIVIASACFGDRFALPVALMLLTLQPRRAQDENIVGRVVELFTQEEILDSLRVCKVDDDHLPELKDFKSLVYAILSRLGELDPLAEGMSLLGL